MEPMGIPPEPDHYPNRRTAAIRRVKEPASDHFRTAAEDFMQLDPHIPRGFS